MVVPVATVGLVGAQVGSAVTGFTLSAMAQAIKTIYGMVGEINDELNKHIEAMKGSENPTISRTGRVLEMAKFGFGLGYISSIVIIAVGQLLVGNTLAAGNAIVTGATLTNPLAMTCAAFGAIYYGWGALSDLERNEMLEKLSKGLDVGIELIKSIVRFVTDKMKELLSSKNIEELKKFVATAATAFGKTLGDVTHKVTDVVSDTFDAVKKKSGEAMGKTIDVASDAYRTVAETAEKAAGDIREKLERPASKDGKKVITKD